MTDQSRKHFLLAALLLLPVGLKAGTVTHQVDPETGWKIYTLSQGETVVRVAPAAGANAFSLVHRRAEYFRTPETLAKLPGAGYGNPILYPMPNRVKGATFTFEGKAFTFPKNGRGNFIHGLVNRAAFTVDKHRVTDNSAEITCSLAFAPGTQPHERFPLEHIFRMTITVREGTVRWTYEVDNSRGKANVPFGLGFHPYVRYQGTRAGTFLHAPATQVMEATRQLPSGKLLELDGHPLDARTPRSLAGYAADDVFFGMTPDRPARIEFREVNRGITFHTSKDFTHLVVWTPDRPYFGIENQTCSTDAHNLAAQGKNDVAHLQVCEAGKKKSGWVEYRLD